jgi:uncharacterized protein YdeI (YjbR/CyaY-like superfamily)
MQEIFFVTRNDFRHWLEYHHDKEDGIWLIYYKKKSGIPSISYEEAVMEALCFGWIDSKVQSIDELRYKQVFTPRRRKSVWSETNKKRVQILIDANMMTPAGMKLIDDAKKSGMWEMGYPAKKTDKIPTGLETALLANPLAWENFNNFAPSYRDIYINWILAAKRPETIQNRIEVVVKNSLMNKKPGIV